MVILFVCAGDKMSDFKAKYEAIGHVYGKATHDLYKLKDNILKGDDFYRFTSTAYDFIVTEIEITIDDALKIVLDLEKEDIFKTMPSTSKEGTMQDVYLTFHPDIGRLYIKLNEVKNKTIIISFHYNES